jgi:predicted nucleic acid-binding protein
MTVFVDTSAFLAVLNADDRFHLSASRCWEELISTEQRLACSNYILVETIALLQNRFGMEAVRVFETDVLPIIDIHWVDQETHTLGVSALLAANRRNLSLVDCTSFAIMRQSNMRRVFAYDVHFADLGFEVLPK